MTLFSPTLDPAICLARIEETPQNPDLWPPLLHSLAVRLKPKEVWSALTLMGNCGMNRIEGLEELGRLLGENQQGQALEVLALSPYSGIEAGFFTAMTNSLLARYYYKIGYDLNRAYSLYDQAIRLFPFTSNFQGLTTIERGSLLRFLGDYTLPALISIDPLSYIQDAPKEDFQQLLASCPALPPADILVFAACDDHYLTLYGQQFLETTFSVMPSASVLIHVINPTAETQAARNQWRINYPRCGFSLETTPQPLQKDITYYAARRFMLSNFFRHHYQRNILILDIDEVMQNSFLNVLKTLSTASMGFWLNKDFLVSNNGILEGIVYASAQSPLADCALESTAAWLRKRHATGRSFWHWDGYALHHGLCHLGDKRQQILDLAPIFPRLPHADGELPQKTVHRMLDSLDDHPKFKRLAALALLQRFDPIRTPQPFQIAGLSAEFLAQISS